MKYLLCAVVALIGLSAPAAAADLGGSYKDGGVPLPEAAGDYTAFRGAYVGIQGGWSSYNHDLSATETPTDGPAFELLNLSSVGAGGGVFGLNGGYNFTAGRWLVGPTFEFNWANNSADLSVYNGAYTAKISHNNEWSIGGRLGYLATPQTVLYGLAAFASADVSVSTSQPVEGLNTGVSFSGYTLGVGAESFLTRDVSLKLEGRWTQFGKETLYSSSNKDMTDAVTSEPSEVAVMVGVNYHPRFTGMDSLK